MTLATEIVMLLVPASILLAVSAVVVFGCLKLLRIGSPVVQRVCWACVLAQGVLLVRLSFGIPWYAAAVPAPSPAAESHPMEHKGAVPTVALLERPAMSEAAADLGPPRGEPGPLDRPATGRAVAWNWREIAVAVWGIGLASLLVFSLLRYVRFLSQLALQRRLVAESAGVKWRQAWEALLAEIGPHRAPQLLVTRNLGPALGLLPRGYRLLVPQAVEERLAPAERLAVLRHEMAHHQRGDLWKSLVARFVVALHWFNPLAWWVLARFETCGEWACDLQAAEHSGRITYARALMQLGGARLPAVPCSTAGNAGPLFVRIRRLLSPLPWEDSLMRSVAAAGFAAVLLLLAAVRFQLVAQQPALPPVSAEASPSVAGEPGVPTPDQPAAPFMRLGTTRLLENGAWMHLAFAPDGRTIVSGNNDRCGVHLWDTTTGELRHAFEHPDCHGSQTGAVAISPDGKKAAATANDSTLGVWEINSGRMLVRAKREKALPSCQAIAFAADSEQLAAAGWDGRIVLWNLADGTSSILVDPEQTDLEGPIEVVALAFSADGRFLASGCGQGIMWNAPPQSAPGTAIRVWDVRDRKQIGYINRVHGDGLCSLQFTPDGQQLVSGGYRFVSGEMFHDPPLVMNVQVPEIFFWDWKNGERTDSLKTDTLEPGFGALALSADGQTLVSGLQDGLRIWDVPSGRSPGKISVPGWNGGHGLALSSQGTLVAAPRRQAIGIWSVATGEPRLQESGQHISAVASAVYSPDGTMIATAGQHGEVIVWDPQNGRSRYERTFGPNSVVSGLACSPDGEILAVGVLDNRNDWRTPGMVRLWDFKSGTQLRDLQPVTNAVDSNPLTIPYRDPLKLAISPDSKFLAVTGRNRSDIDIWEIASGEKVAELRPKPAERGKPHISDVCRMVFSADSKVLYVAGHSYVHVWDIAAASPLREFVPLRGDPVEIWRHDTPWVADAVFSPDLRTVTISQGNQLETWDLSEGRHLSAIELPGHDKGRILELSPNGRLLAIGEVNYISEKSTNLIRLWDLRLGRQVASFDPQDGRGRCFAFSPDSRWLVAGTWRCTALIWQVPATEP